MYSCLSWVFEVHPFSAVRVSSNVISLLCTLTFVVQDKANLDGCAMSCGGVNNISAYVGTVYPLAFVHVHTSLGT